MPTLKDLTVIRKKIRCGTCFKRFTDLTLVVDEVSHKEGSVKIGFDTLCPRCKDRGRVEIIDSKVFVI